MIRIAKKTHAILVVLVAGALIAMGTQPAQAVPLNLLLDPPDISNFFVSMAYDATAEELTASGFPNELDDNGLPGDNFPIDSTPTPSSFSLTANIDNGGNLLGGDFIVTGSIDDAPIGPIDGVLLTGDLSALGFPDAGGDPIEFLYEVTGGLLAGVFGGIGETGGIILEDNSLNFTGSWANDFNNIGSTLGTANIVVPRQDVPGVVPEPVTAGLSTLGIGSLVLSLRRRRAA